MGPNNQKTQLSFKLPRNAKSQKIKLKKYCLILITLDRRFLVCSWKVSTDTIILDRLIIIQYR
ncbi:hypothetical protein BpHYR1_009013 [Brachionus plicatilis]|uniref:Uncharacterized protein n=1 Tax=Brachionus plicatilis TaxID=10195 RepID=A0A3M7QDP6_BRAPC|nr:hypothetical protein BpHYR1_009013 [Brachionus plicatilis]